MLHVFLLRVPCFVGLFGKKCRESVLLMIVYIDQDRKLNVEDGQTIETLKFCQLRQSGNVHLCAICDEITFLAPVPEKRTKLSSDLLVNPQLNFLFSG